MDDQLAKTPLYAWHAAHGGRLVDFAGWAMPVQYSTIVEEHLATRTAAALFDVSHMGRFLLEGPALDWLDGLLTRRVNNLPYGRVRYALVTNDQGGVQDDVLVYHLPHAKGNVHQQTTSLLVVNASNRAKIWDWLQQRLPSSAPFRLTDITLQTAMIAVQGPKACAWAQQALSLPEAAHLKPYGCAELSIRPTADTSSPWIYSRTGYTGEDGLELIVPASLAVGIWEQLLASDGPGTKAAGLGARDTLRLEAAMPLYGHELTEETNVAQTGLDFALDLEGREFPGREAIIAEIQRGDLPVRVGLELDGKRVARETYVVRNARGNAVGHVTSGTFSPTLQKAIGMAYVRPENALVGSQVMVDIRGRDEPARVVALPFYRRTP